MRLYFLHIKNLAVIENAKEYCLAKLVLQTIEIGPCACAEIQPLNRFGSQFEELQPQAIAPRVRVLDDQAVLFQHHHEPMHGALVQLQFNAQFR